MKHINQLFPSRYLSSDDLVGDVTVTISGIKQAAVGEGEEKPCLMLQGSKDFILNQTNAKSIAKLHGNDIEKWVGCQITLFADDSVMFKGRITTGIRVRGPQMPMMTNPNMTIGRATINAHDQQVLKDLYTLNMWPVDEVKRMVLEVASVESLAHISSDHFQTLSEYFGRNYPANYGGVVSEDGTIDDLDADEIPF